MTLTTHSSVRALLGASALTLSLLAGPALAETVFTKPLVDFAGDVSAGGVDRAPVLKGGKAVIEGEDMIPGQTVTLMRGTTVLNPAPITVARKGSFSFTLVNEHGIARHSERLYPEQYESAEPLQAVIDRTRQALVA